MTPSLRAFALVIAFLSPLGARAAIVAFDLVGSTSQNLITHTNAYAGAYSSVGDGFEIYQRGVSATIPFSVIDDSLVTFPADEQGIIDENNLGRFFGVVDTVNGDPPPDTVTASWDFDVAGFTGLSLSVDIGAMGDFEDGAGGGTEDLFAWAYGFDGGALTTLFTSVVNEGATQTYILADGDLFNLDDPLTLNGIPLSNSLQTFTAPLLGSGSVLTVVLAAQADSSGEAFAFQNLIIEDQSTVPEPGAVVLVGMALLGMIVARRCPKGGKAAAFGS